MDRRQMAVQVARPMVVPTVCGMVGVARRASPRLVVQLASTWQEREIQHRLLSGLRGHAVRSQDSVENLSYQQHDQMSERTVSSLREAVALLDEWIAYARELEAENLRLRLLGVDMHSELLENLRVRMSQNALST